MGRQGSNGKTNKTTTKVLAETSLIESIIILWLEIGGRKQITRYVDIKPRTGKIDQINQQRWKSGSEYTTKINGYQVKT